MVDQINRVGAYVRVSTLEQAQKGYSVGEQKDKLKKYCEIKDWLLAKTYVDPGFSGSNLERPAMQQMIMDCEDHKLDTILVYKLDRISRSQKDTLHLLEDVFEKNNVSFVSLNENFDTSTAFGRASIGILSVFAQLEREQIKERMAMGKTGRAKKGLYQGGGVIPFGYDYENGQLIINQAEADVVKAIFTMYKSGMGPALVANTLNEQGFVGKTTRWSHKSVAQIIRNQTYIGKINWKGEVYDGQHEPIIDDKTFNDVQTIIDRRNEISQKWNARPFQARNLLTGIVYCSECGARYRITKTWHSHTSRYVRKYECYSRGHHHGTPNMVRMNNCPNEVYLASTLETYVMKQIKKLAFHPNRLPNLRNRKNSENQVEQINRDLKDISNQMTRLMDLYQKGKMEYDLISDRIDELNNRKASLGKTLKKVKKNNTQDLTVQNIFDLLAEAPEIIDSGDFNAKRRLILSLIEKIIIKGDKVKLYWNF